MQGAALERGVIATQSSVCPAGLSAMWSFAEVIRRGCQSALDLPSDELQVGLQPVRVDDVETRRLFLADRLENGAGYAPEVGRAESIKEILRGILTTLADQYDSPGHGDCTDACPNCLRSWDNRRLHGALDWRLALDVATLANGEALYTGRWLDRAPRLADQFVRAYREAVHTEVIETGDLLAIATRDRQRAVILGHPLWLHRPEMFNEEQAIAFDVARADLGIGEVIMSDVWVLHRRAPQIFGMLARA